jgi:hypothetical protein
VGVTTAHRDFELEIEDAVRAAQRAAQIGLERMAAEGDVHG